MIMIIVAVIVYLVITASLCGVMVAIDEGDNTPWDDTVIWPLVTTVFWPIAIPVAIIMVLPFKLSKYFTKEAVNPKENV